MICFCVTPYHLLRLEVAAQGLSQRQAFHNTNPILLPMIKRLFIYQAARIWQTPNLKKIHKLIQQMSSEFAYL